MENKLLIYKNNKWNNISININIIKSKKIMCVKLYYK